MHHVPQTAIHGPIVCLVARSIRRILLPGAQEAEALRVTVALTDVRRANPAVNAATFGVVGLATRPSVLRAEVDITDADDGTRVAALTCPGTGGVFEGRNGITRSEPPRVWRRLG